MAFHPVDSDTMRFTPSAIHFFDHNQEYEFKINTEGQLSIQGQLRQLPEEPRITCVPAVISFNVQRVGYEFSKTKMNIIKYNANMVEHSRQEWHMPGSGTENTIKLLADDNPLHLIIVREDTGKPIVRIKFKELEQQMFANFLNFAKIDLITANRHNYKPQQSNPLRF